MRDNLGLALTYIFDDEAGWAKRAAEPGGAVNRGISFLAFKEWRLSQGKPTPTFDNLKNISADEATEIYTKKYAEPLGFDDLPTPMDYVALNTAVMDGVAGAKHLMEAAGGDPMLLLLLQAAAKMKSKSVGSFGTGWGDRLLRVAARAKAMK